MPIFTSDNNFLRIEYVVQDINSNYHFQQYTTYNHTFVFPELLNLPTSDVSMQNVLDCINSVFDNLVPENPLFHFELVNNYIKITSFSNIYSMTIFKNTLSNMLGFTGNEKLIQIDHNQQDDQFGSYITSINTYNLYSQNLFVQMFISNLSINTSNADKSKCHFKIPTVPINRTSELVVYTYNELSNYTQYIQNSDMNYVLDKLVIQLYDRNGSSLNSQILNFSFTLEFEYIE